MISSDLSKSMNTDSNRFLVGVSDSETNEEPNQTKSETNEKPNQTKSETNEEPNPTKSKTT